MNRPDDQEKPTSGEKPLGSTTQVLAGSSAALEAVRQVLPLTRRIQAAVGPLLVEGWVGLLLGTAGVPIDTLLSPEVAPDIEAITQTLVRSSVVERAVERWTAQRRDARETVARLVEQVRDSLARLEQTEAVREAAALAYARLRSGDARIRLWTQGPLDTRALIFVGGDAALLSPKSPLVAASASGAVQLFLRDRRAAADLQRWFGGLWSKARDVGGPVCAELEHSWALATPTPYEVYLKALYHLVRDRIDAEGESSILWADTLLDVLTDFQRDAVRTAVQMVQRVGGCFVADVVGLGKSYVGAAILKHLEQTVGARALILCPASLVPMWDRYDELFQLNARVVSFGLLREGTRIGDALAGRTKELQDRDLVLVDEGHHFRNPNTQRYRLLQSFLGLDRKVVLLSATPYNKSAMDVYHQLKLFHQDDKTHLPITPPNLREFFRRVERGAAQLPDLLSHMLLRRTRRDIIRQYGLDEETHRRVAPEDMVAYLDGRRRAYVQVGERRQFFPRRRLEVQSYDIDHVYAGLYQRLRDAVAPQAALAPPAGALRYAYYNLLRYVKPAARARYDGMTGAAGSLAGLMRVLLFKRLESSVEAFRETLGRMLRAHDAALASLLEGEAPTSNGKTATRGAEAPAESVVRRGLRAAIASIRPQDLDRERLATDLRADRSTLSALLELVRPLAVSQDAKLGALHALLARPELSSKKVLIFTEFTDTAQYLFDGLSQRGEKADVDWVAGSTGRSKAEIAARFSPLANPDARQASRGPEIRILVATDVLSEGLNLQDCNCVVNYDLHWNPVRLIQRFGRVDRIGTSHDVIFAFNFLPSVGVEKNLGLATRLRNRIREIHRAIGEDAAILDPSEQLNERAMYAIYGGAGESLGALEASDALFRDVLAEGEARLRDLRDSDPEAFAKIAHLADGVRTARRSPDGDEGVIVLLKAGEEVCLYWAPRGGPAVRGDLTELLARLDSNPTEARLPVPAWAGAALERARADFEVELAKREGGRRFRRRPTAVQRRVLQRLRDLEQRERDEDRAARFRIIASGFEEELPVAVRRRLRGFDPEALGPQELLSVLSTLYHEYALGERRQRSTLGKLPAAARLLCSVAFVAAA